MLLGAQWNCGILYVPWNSIKCFVPPVHGTMKKNSTTSWSWCVMWWDSNSTLDNSRHWWLFSPHSHSSIQWFESEYGAVRRQHISPNKTHWFCSQSTGTNRASKSENQKRDHENDQPIWFQHDKRRKRTMTVKKKKKTKQQREVEETSLNCA